MKHKKGGRRILAALVSMVLAFSVFSGIAVADDSDSITAVRVAVTYQQTQARSMLEMINEFRTGDDAWYWNTDDTTKTTLTNLSELTYDYTLEQIAMQRAAEIALSFSHTRTDGTTCWTAYNDYSYIYGTAGENIAVASFSSTEKIFTAWQETDEDYSGQGHRRNMLSGSFTHVGIACVYYNGMYYWVQEFAKPSGASANTAETTANDGETTVKINVLNSDLTSCIVGTTPEEITLDLAADEDKSADLPTVTASLKMTNTYPSTKTCSVTVVDPVWSIADTDIASVSDDILSAVSKGTTELTATVLEKTVSVPVTVTCTHSSDSKLTWDWSDDYSAATATLNCASCGEEQSVKAGITSSTTEATCITFGSTVYTATATIDGTVYTDKREVEIAKTDHTAAEAVVENEEAPACTETGSYDSVVYCSVCGTELSRTVVKTEALGHAFDDGVVEVEATVSSEGSMIYTCTVCGTTMTEIISKVDDTDLSDTVDEVLTLNGSDYTGASWDAVQAALAEAEKVLSNDDATAEEVAIALTTLKNAIRALESKAVLNGVVKGTDGKWGYYINGTLQKNYTGFQSNSNGLWYIEKGNVTFAKNGVIKDSATGKWYYVVASQVQTSYTGVADYSNAAGWWYVSGGKVQLGYTGLAKNKNGWFYVKGGKVDFSYTGKAANKYGTWNVVSGKVKF